MLLLQQAKPHTLAHDTLYIVQSPPTADSMPILGH